MMNGMGMHGSYTHNHANFTALLQTYAPHDHSILLRPCMHTAYRAALGISMHACLWRHAFKTNYNSITVEIQEQARVGQVV